MRNRIRLKKGSTSWYDLVGSSWWGTGKYLGWVEGSHVEVRRPSSNLTNRMKWWKLISRNLIQAAETLKWPTKIIYPNVPATQRRAFERAYQDLLYLQAEYVLSPPLSRQRMVGSSTDRTEERDYIQEVMEIGPKAMDCIHYRLLLKGLN